MSQHHPSRDAGGGSAIAAPGHAGPAPADQANGGPAGQPGPGGRSWGPAFRAVTAASVVCAYLLVVLGDTVRVTESGMGCRSWPLCNGSAGLTGTYHALLEQGHRYVAAVVTALVVITFAVAWRLARENRLVFWSATAALGLIGVQVVLGAITVFTHNAGWTVALHLAGAWLVVAAVTATAAGVWRAPASVPDGSAPRVTPGWRVGAVAAVSLFALSVSGMLVLHDGASTACPGWPSCGLGTSQGLVLQYVHRSLALITAVLIIAQAVSAWRSRAEGLAGRRVLAGAAVLLLAGTVALGAIVATSGASPAEQDLHLAVGSALWICVVAMASVVMPRPGGQASGLG